MSVDSFHNLYRALPGEDLDKLNPRKGHDYSQTVEHGGRINPRDPVLLEDPETGEIYRKVSRGRDMEVRDWPTVAASQAAGNVNVANSFQSYTVAVAKTGAFMLLGEDLYRISTTLYNIGDGKVIIGSRQSVLSGQGFTLPNGSQPFTFHVTGEVWAVGDGNTDTSLSVWCSQHAY